MISCNLESGRYLAKSRRHLGRFSVGKLHFDAYFQICRFSFDHGFIFFNATDEGAGDKYYKNLRLGRFAAMFFL